MKWLGPEKNHNVEPICFHVVLDGKHLIFVPRTIFYLFAKGELKVGIEFIIKLQTLT